MDIQSSTLNAIFELVAVFVPGWVSPIKPPARAHGGIPRSLYDDKPSGLQVVIDPWSELQRRNQIMEAYDSVALYVNDAPTSVAGAIVQPGDEQKRISLNVPHGHLIHGVNRLHYKVTRLSGNVESSRDLLVLYHLRPLSSLDLVIPPNVVTNGVSAALAALGVVFGFTYNTAHPYDLVRFRIGNESFTKEVTDPPTPLTITLFTADFLKVGDGKIVVDFVVTDQLGNSATSGTKTLDVHVAHIDLQPPTVIGQTGNNFSPTQTQIRVLVPTGPLLPTDQFTVTWTGATSTAAGSYTSPPQSVSAGLEIAVPRSVLAYSLGKIITVTYTLIRNGVPSTSLALLLNILVLPAAALITPKIIDADTSNVLDLIALGSKDGTIHGLLWTLIEVGQQVWLTLEGKKADGSPHTLNVWNGGASKVNTAWVNQGFWPKTVANSYLNQLGDGSTLTIKFKAALDQSNIEANAVVFPDRTYTIRSVALVAPTITSVKGSPSGVEIPQGGSTVETAVTLTGAASKGLQVEVFDGAVSKGKATANASTGIWTLTVSGLAVAEHSLTAKALYGSGQVSAARTLTIITMSWTENFDLYPRTELYPGNPLNTPDLSISVVMYAGNVIIMQSTAFIPTPLPGKFSGMVLMLRSDDGTPTSIRFELKKKCTRINFWLYNYGSYSSRSSIFIYDSDGKLIKQESLPDFYPESTPEQYDFASSDIASFEIHTTNLITVDHCSFWG
ncbi:Ig-like domain-containing protein [Pseudomonas sp. H1h]|uniref:Ig-like domain-containing protein n=1 Tax=Pseudomonas sp. H1h TaxID=1397280 RepID=UPI000469A748|nr:Ig-like domain-containing protein [Pseudomonas sp. H1h]